MTDLDQAMEKHMANVVHSENRPFSYRDFMAFEVDGQECRMSHGTYRNKILGLTKSGKVEKAYNAGVAFHTLKGKRFGKPMTLNHEGVCNSKMDSLSRLINDLPTERAALHDIRLKFKVPSIWNMISSTHQEFPINQNSKDICIPTWRIDDLLIRIVIHKTDTISVSIACSLAPIPVSLEGIICLSNALTRVEERLATLLTNNGFGDYHLGLVGSSPANNDMTHQYLRIPNHRLWLVIMWHFGIDALVEYAGEKFVFTWEESEHVLIRAYTKTMMDRKTRIRLERQEYPNKTVPEIIEEKLKQKFDFDN
jgi:hypothetical protein